MTTSALGAVLSATLVVAGASKAFSPGPLGRSLAVVLGVRHRQSLTETTARIVGAVELAAALLVSLPWFHRTGAVLGALVGVGILGFVAIARIKQLRIACGCFGSGSDKPVGVLNLGAGVFLTVGFGVLLVAGPSRWDEVQLGSNLAMTAFLALVVVLAIRFRAYATPVRRGLGRGR